MFDDAADEIQTHIRKSGITVACKQRRAFVPDRKMRVHPRAIIFLDRLWHERRGFAVRMRHLMDDIFVDLHPVSRCRQRTVGQAKLMLRGGNFMVMLVAGQAEFEHGRHHFGADING